MSDQKTADKVEPKFKVGDWIVNDYCFGKVIEITNDAYLLDTGQGIPFSCEHNVHLWTINDAKDGDVLFHSDSASNGIFIFKEIIDKGFAKEVICYCDYDSEDHFCLGEHHTCCWTDAKILHPSTKEQRDTLLKAMADAGYTFDFESKELKKIEHKSTDRREPKFKVGDWVVNPYGDVWHIDSLDGKIYQVSNKGKYNYFPIAKQDEIHLWTIADAKDGDILYSPCNKLLWIFKTKDTVHCICNLNYNNDSICGEGHIMTPTDTIPATKSQRDTLFAKMKEEGYEWSEETHELKKISQRTISAEAKESLYDKPTDEEMKELLRTEYEKGRADTIAEMKSSWSEEDEKMLEGIVNTVKDIRCQSLLSEIEIYDDYIDWLKSLKDRYTWKPSKGQLECLDVAIDKVDKDHSPFFTNRAYLTLKALKKQLEQL